jgi:hypothetical protein
MVKSIANIRSTNDGATKKVFFRVRTDSTGFKGKVKIFVGPSKLPDQDADIAGEDSVPFSATHRESGLLVVKASAGDASSSVLLDLDLPKDPS